MLVYIYPVTTNRYDIQNEADMGNGRTDILLVPLYGSTSPPDSSYYYIFELKHYQVERYLNTASDKAKYCQCIFEIGAVFWINRFCMAVTKLRRVNNKNGSINWQAMKYPGGIDRDGAVSYDDIDDDLKSTENDCVYERVV
ncbi:hypothetical protein EV175_003763 [Coemansia sp. RSA 1933]|nr:hypothetical protein EV175_003763 [Coemansia sp. RSA 1933]